MPECVFGNLKVHVEVPIFLLFFAFLISDSLTSNLIIFRTCYVTLGYNKSECALLGGKHPDSQTASLEKIVEPYSAVIKMACSLTENFSSAFFCLFGGPWSDRFGRKPLLILPVLGYLMFYVSYTLFSVVENASAWYLLFSYIPVALTGGFATYLTVLLCYVTDLTGDKDRGMRLAFVEAAMFLGSFLGTASSSYIFEATGYHVTFLISATCCCLALVFTGFFIPESLTEREHEGRFKGFFQVSNITDMVKVTFKKRQNYARYTVICCLLMTILSILVMNGNDAIQFLFLREKFHWSLQKYTLYMAAYSLVYVFGTILGVYVLHKLLKIPETIMILVAVMSSLNGALVMGFAETEWAVYSVALFRMLGGVFGPMLRLLVSKVVPNEEVGNIFALVIAIQFLFGMAGSPLYTLIYNKTITTNPAMFNFVSAGIYTLLILINVGVIAVRTVLSRNANGNYSQLTEEERRINVEM